MTVSDASTTDLETDSAGSAAAEEKQKLNLEIKVDKTGACGRHITVTVSKEDVQRYFEKAFSDLMPKASVPGFRAGRAPRKLVESKFKLEVNNQVKGSLLMDSMGQVTADSSFAAISEPDFDFGAIELMPEGPLTYEFDIEVRPEFDLPQWKGLKLERPVRTFTREDIDTQLQQMLSDVADLVPHGEPAAAGDYVVLQVRFEHEGKTISECVEEFQVAERISFPDAIWDGFAKSMIGVKVGDRREGKVNVSHESANESLRGVQLQAFAEVLDVKRVQIPKLDGETLKGFGRFESEGELRDEIQQVLEQRLVYAQERRIREQITDLLTESADWDLPREMLRRQAGRELDRAQLELQRSGFSVDEIRAHENELRQNSLVSTRRALKEHFILERIAEEEAIEDLPGDYEGEIALIARQTREPVRRVRARIEKQGLMDVLRNQIIERKVIALIKGAATFKDVPLPVEKSQVFAVDHLASGVKDTVIPVAKHADESEQLRLPTDRT